MKRPYIVQFDSETLPRLDTDFLVIGSGSAGLRSAIEANQHGKVLLITKSAIEESNTSYAQGGIAVAMNVEDTIDSHIEDTLKAGVGLSNEEIVQVMVREGIDRVSELIEWGANFDRDGDMLGFTIEGAHEKPRILHHRDATGRETSNVLLNQLDKQKHVQILENAFAVDFVTDDSTCYGALTLIDNVLYWVRSKSTILASGGLGRIYQYTSNPEIATGDGCAAAWRAGCEMIDMEFVQFHPTTLSLDGAPNFLISEAIRGEGGVLVNIRGEQFMKKYHDNAELGPRDVVSRAILNEMKLTDFPCVFLDVTHLSSEFLQARFPTIYQTCNLYGLDIARDLIPVQSAAHFMMGGVRTNVNAQTNIRGLYACGEVACVGVHGANRLASNSLLECIVFGTRAARSAVEYAQSFDKSKYDHIRLRTEGRNKPHKEFDAQAAREAIQRLMWENVGILRTDSDLKTTHDAWLEMGCEHSHTNIEEFELQNMLDVAKLITESAIIRTESRGAHYRMDYAQCDESDWKKHIVLSQNCPPKFAI